MNFPLLPSILLSACLGLAAAPAAPAQEDPIEQALIDPDLIMVHRDQIGVSDAQIDAIHLLFDKAAPFIEPREKQLRQLSLQLGKALEAHPMEETKALELLDQILDTESQIRRRHFQIMIQVKKQLAPEQLEAARKVRRELPENYRQIREETNRRLENKLERIQRGMQAREQSGDPSLEAGQLMESVPKLMEHGRFKEAEEILDRTLKLLEK